MVRSLHPHSFYVILLSIEDVGPAAPGAVLKDYSAIISNGQTSPRPTHPSNREVHSRAECVRTPSAQMGDEMMELIRDRSVEYRDIGALKPNARNPRTHSKKQTKQLANAMDEFGFTNPIIVDEQSNILAGHGRLVAAKHLGLSQVPTICITGMTDAQKRAYVIADNRLAEHAGWDEPLLADELQTLIDEGFDFSVTGFETDDIDRLLGLAAAPVDNDEAIVIPAPGAEVVSSVGDIWCIGDHFIICGDARERSVYDRLLRGERAEMVFTDAPYNVKIKNNVSGLGRTVHREFVMGSGEMTKPEFADFLRAPMQNMAAVSKDGAIHFFCMDWRHISEVLDASEGIYSEFKNLCVWAKTNASMGAFYRSQHELVFVFKVGTAEHINNFGLGGKGRYRTNLWTYAGANTFRAGRMKDLAVHPTVKPVKMIADAILDCSNRNGVILDPFAGSGSTLIAAARTGRRGYGIELDPAYVDLCVRRLEEETGEEAVDYDGTTFAEVARQRQLGEAA